MFHGGNTDSPPSALASPDHSVHRLAKLDQQLIGGLQPYQALTQVIKIQDNVHDDYRDNRETKDVEPTSVLGACHTVAGE